MDKEKRGKAAWLRLLPALAVLLAMTFSLLPGEGRAMNRTYERDDGIIGNPLMGYAPPAQNESLDADITLVYVDITWRELEPEKGVYAFDEITRENQLARWRAEGKHVVLRFVCDVPGETRHMDIPDWLYEETGDGQWYNTSYGKGYSPDYGNPLFIEYHARAVAALGEEYGGDTLISYVELGSLGHWGEWHVLYEAGLPRIPEESVRLSYITPWLSAFPQAKILMRRPFRAAQEYGLGLFNDMAGHAEDTEEWLLWIEEGGDYGQAREKDALVPMPDFWKTAPSGGELTSSFSMKSMLTDRLEQTLSMLERSHTTFLGPKIASAKYREGYEALLRHMGYRLFISQAELTGEGAGTRLSLVWENAGIAPLYWDWPVEIYVLDGQGQIRETAAMDIELSHVLPGAEISASVLLETPGLEKEDSGYRIAVGIIDPMTGQRALRLTMRAPWEQGMTILFE